MGPNGLGLFLAALTSQALPRQAPKGTAPSWGLGLIAQVNGHSRLLHDGRARNVEEAILWRGGEADAARRAFEKLSAAERAALIGFLGSL